MVVFAHEAPTIGAHIEVCMGRGRYGRRKGTVIDVRGFEAMSQGTVIVVRWDDDGLVSSLVPGADLEVIQQGGGA